MSTTMKGQINAEVDTALNTAIPGTPTANSVNERVATMDDAYTATRGGYLDELAAANIPADLDLVLADTNELQSDDYPTRDGHAGHPGQATGGAGDG
jgi:hypothetical protein